MKKMNFTNNQTAFEYALYMIASSYFNKATCKSVLTERNMFLQYREQKLNNQYQMEDICIQYMDELVKKIPAKVFQQNMVVHFKRTGIGQPMEIIFRNEKYIVCFIGGYAGKQSKIESSVWAR